MKIRTGFVSNSSSSSFVIGIAKVKNEEAVLKIKEYIDKNQELIGTAQIISYGGLQSFVPEGVELSKEFISIESFTYDSVELKTEHLQAEDYVLLVNGSGYHDDDDFIVEDEDGEFLEYDYDIELSFPGYIDGILALLHDYSLCEYGRSYTGAGRNG